MTSLACFIANLLQLPPAIRLSIAAWRLLAGVLRVFAGRDAETLALLTPHDRARLDFSLQLAEACIARIVWLQARKLAGLPPAPPPSPFRYAPPHHLAAPQAMAARALRLLDRLVRAATAAQRMAQRISLEQSRPRRPGIVRTRQVSARIFHVARVHLPRQIALIRATGPPWRGLRPLNQPLPVPPRRPIVSGDAGARLHVERLQARPVESGCGR